MIPKTDTAGGISRTKSMVGLGAAVAVFPDGMFTEDLRIALRTLRKSPSFTATAVLALAAGIGANAAIFSMVDALLLRPLPMAHADRLVEVWEDASSMGFPHGTPAPANFVDWKQRNHVFLDMAADRGDIVAITGDGPPEEVEESLITANWLPVLGVTPLLGRNILEAEDAPGASNIALISHRLWQQRYGGDPRIVGRDILLDGIKHRVIGVMPPGFIFPRHSDVWRPLALSNADRNARDSHYLHVYGRLRPGISIADGQRDMTAIASQLEREYPDSNAHIGAAVIGLREELLGPLDLALHVLAGGVGLVLLICCANIAGLMLARAAGREREMAVRAALGAGRWRLARQGLTESLIIALGGAALGVLFAVYGLEPLSALVPQTMRGWSQPQIDGHMLLFVASAAVLSAALCGALPAMGMARVDVAAILQQGGRAGIGGKAKLRRSLVVAEVALAVILCGGAGLMLKTVWALTHVDLGFQPEQVLTMRTQLPARAGSRYAQFPARQVFYETVIQRVKAIPGIIDAGYTTFLPLTNRGGTSGFVIEGAPPPERGHRPDANRRAVTRDYFHTIGMRLIAGRWFDEHDRADSPPVAIINEAAAKQYWPGQNPVGRRFHLGGPEHPWTTIVGIVNDVRQMGLDAPGRAEMYFSASQPEGPVGFFTPRDLAVRVTGDPLSYANAVRQAIWSVDADQPVTDVQPLTALVSSETTTQRAQLWLLGGFAALALVLAAIGLYGLLSHMVAQRTRDIGVRMALGARRGQVMASVIGQGLRLVSVGLVTGTAAAFWLTRLMQRLLFGVKPADPATFVIVAAILGLAGALACYVPARRATRIDPMQALRHE
jgi:putative ABC transport system permease protein